MWCHPPLNKTLKCTSLAWRPDGKVLAVGYGGGRLILLDTEGKSELYSFAGLGNATVTALTWADSGIDEQNEEEKSREDGGGGGDRAGALQVPEEPFEFLTELPQLKKAYSYNLRNVGEEDLAPIQRLYDSESPACVLLVGTDNGNVGIYINGYLHCGSINVSSLVEERQVTITDLALAPDLATFSVVYKIMVSTRGIRTCDILKCFPPFFSLKRILKRPA